MILNDKNYKILKWFVLIVLPASTTLFGVIGLTLNWDNVDGITTIMVAITTFLGSIIGISNANFKKEEEK